MIYTKDELITMLIESHLIVETEGGYLVNMVLAKKTNRSEKFCLNYPEKFIGLSDSIIHEKVINQCAIPLMYRGDMSYFLRTQTKESVRKLKELLQDPTIDYEIFIETTRNFYRSEVATPGFANYLVKGTWRNVYSDTSEIQREKGSMKGLMNG